MLVRLAALIAVDAPPASYLLNLAAASEVGVTEEQVEGVLIGIAPVVGTARVRVGGREHHPRSGSPSAPRWPSSRRSSTTTRTRDGAASGGAGADRAVRRHGWPLDAGHGTVDRRAVGGLVPVTGDGHGHRAVRSATWAVWTWPGSTGGALPQGPGGHEGGSRELPAAGDRVPVDRREHEDGLVEVAGRPRSARPPSAGPASRRWRRRWPWRRPSGAPPGPCRCRPRGAHGPRPARPASGRAGRRRPPGRRWRAPRPPPPRTGPAPGTTGARRTAGGGGDGGQRQRVVGEGPQVQHRRPVVDGEEAAGVGPAEGAGDAEGTRRPRPPPGRRGRTARRRHSGDRPSRSDQAQLRQCRLQQQVAQALERVAHADAEHGKGDDADEGAAGRGRMKGAPLPAVRWPELAAPPPAA